MKNGQDNIVSMNDISAAIKSYAAATRGYPVNTFASIDPYTHCPKKFFQLSQRVMFVNLPEDCELLGQYGTILGKSSVNVIDTYIVMLDNPVPEAFAIVMTESCLEAV
jgi:hypothetical protein